MHLMAWLRALPVPLPLRRTIYRRDIGSVEPERERRCPAPGLPRARRLPRQSSSEPDREYRRQAADRRPVALRVFEQLSEQSICLRRILKRSTDHSYCFRGWRSAGGNARLVTWSSLAFLYLKWSWTCSATCVAIRLDEHCLGARSVMALPACCQVRRQTGRWPAARSSRPCSSAC